MKLYGNITKIDAEKRMVWGYASTEAKDRVGETVLKSAIAGALDDYLVCGNIREMHQLSAVGITEEAEVDDKGLYIGAKIVDDSAWKKVTEGVYKGFSIGGKVMGRDTLDKSVVTAVRLDEISLVDRPANPEAHFDMWKAAGVEGEDDGLDGAGAVGDGDPSLEGTQPEILKTVEGDAEEKAGAGAPFEGSTEVVPEAGAEGNSAGNEGTEEAAGEVTPEADPITKATNAVSALENAINAVAPPPAEEAEPNKLGKGMYTVSCFADLLSAVSMLVYDTADEAEWEGDGSQIPAALRGWLQQGANIFVSMAQEEVSELVARVNSTKTTQAEALAKAAGVAETEEQLQKALSANEDLQKALNTITEKVEPLVKTVTELGERLHKMEQEPVPARTAGPGAQLTSISKATDSTGQEQVSQLTEENLAKALGAMSEEDRALLLIKAAHLNPRALTFK